jgi:hypothetical protein
MNNSIEVRQMTGSDVELVYRVFTEHDIGKPRDYILKCWEQNVAGERITLLAFYQGQFAGSLHLLATSHYPYFVENGIPEINDFNVIPPLLKLGIGNALMEVIEKIAFEKYGIVGIGCWTLSKLWQCTAFIRKKRIYARWQGSDVSTTSTHPRCLVMC